ncbi:ImmA/IrrE family metallo-endopeptidase [Rothia nasimurium]|nr:ImmA/IrrE family metallo-endopeptidase [Rothia nasimurium]MBF0807119.1 ImmA/IrrE family metallo-endopeptidase [Rothia nasimurium]
MVAISPSRTLPVWQAARYEARQLLESKVWDGTYPVKITPFARALDVNVNYTDLEHVSGLIVKKGRDIPAEVLLNSKESYQRRRFTLAHELGHLIERSTISGDQQFDFVDLRPDPLFTAQNSTYNLHEFYADEFAGSLLMPATKVEELRSEGWSVARMAAFFDVTPSAMSKRIERLMKHDESKVPDAL